MEKKKMKKVKKKNMIKINIKKKKMININIKKREL